jgi:putative transposase
MERKTVQGIVYHVLSRGVDKRKIFLDNKDRLRFIHDVFEFNDTQPPTNLTYYFKSKVFARPKIRRKRRLLVELLAFCLMPNHYHLLLRPLFDNAVFKFMKKLNMGYAKYFNEKYKRRGTLFEGRYKLIAVSDESHFIHLPYYIHFNPLDLVMPEWRERKIRNPKKAMEFLENYRWSSFCDYIGKENFPSVTQREFLSEIFGGPENCRRETLKWLQELDPESIRDITMDE